MNVVSSADRDRVVNPRPVAKIKTGRVSRPITDSADETGHDRSWNAMRPWCFAVVSVDDEERYQPGRVLPCRTV